MTDDEEFFLDFTRPSAALEGGQELEETWLSRPMRAGVPADQYPPSRFDDFIFVGMSAFVDPEGSSGYADPTLDTVSFVLSADGVVLAESDQTFIDAEVPPERTSYELVLDVQRELPEWWQTSTATHTVWQFESEHVDGEEQLELLQVDYDVELSPTNQTTTWPFMISFRPYNLSERGPGAGDVAPSEITDFTAEWSIDDGSTWSDVRELSEQEDGWWVGGIGVPPACGEDCYVSLRVSATDDGGASMEQMITRAFRAVYVEPTPTPTEPTTPEPTGTTTLPGTGAGSAASLALVGALSLLAGGLLVAIAASRLRRANGA